MKSKTTFWGQVGATGTAFVGLPLVVSLWVNDDPMLKKILGIVVLVGAIVAIVAKLFGGLASADAEVVQPEKSDKTEPAKP